MRRLLNNSWIMVLGAVMPFASAIAEEHGAAAGGALSTLWSAPLAVGLGIALAVIAASTAQGRIAAAFMEGVSRNPGAQKSMFVPLILSLALVESLVLFTFLIVNSMGDKLH